VNHWRIGTTSEETAYLCSAEVSLETTGREQIRKLNGLWTEIQ
jgi:hypothetical protein